MQNKGVSESKTACFIVSCHFYLVVVREMFQDCFNVNYEGTCIVCAFIRSFIRKNRHINERNTAL